MAFHVSSKPSLWFPVVFIFLLTLKFQAFNNLLIPLLFALSFKRISIKPYVLFVAMMFSAILLAYFFFIENIVFLKYSSYLLRFLMLVFLARGLVDSRLELSLALEIVFFTLSIAIILCYIFPPFNNFMISYFSYAGGSKDRVTGFIQGYEFVPFIMTIYLAYDYLNIGKIITRKFIIKLLLGALVSLFSGRYSAVPLTTLLLFIAFDRRHILLKLTIFTGAIGIVVLVFNKIIINIVQTALLLKDYAIFGADYDFSKYSSGSADGVVVENQYNLSPLSLLNEIMHPFIYWEDHILPSAMLTIDPGPSYLISNLGFIFTCALYVFFFKAIGRCFKQTIPIIVVLLFLIIDLKFRSLYVLMPTCWLLINHVNYVNNLGFRR
tara:strand:+ start:2181 stop:3320 length:1140 start_codon:yes stop_codon:yes gene_type:complete